MAKPHKKNKFTKATPPVEKCSPYHYYSESDVEITQALHNKVQEETAKQMGKILMDNVEKPKGPVTSATEAMAGFKSMQPTAKQFCTFLRAKLSHADPRITDVKMWWEPAQDFWHFTIYVNDENKFGYNISGETIHHMAQGNYDQAVEIVFDQISIAFYKQFPKPKTPPKLLGSNHGFINYANFSKDDAFGNEIWANVKNMLDAGVTKDQVKELMFPSHPIISSVPGVDPVKPIPIKSQYKPTAPPPTPPEKDKFYGLSPEVAYNIGLKQIKQSAVQHKYSNDVNGSLLEEVKEEQKKLAEYQAAKHKKFKELYSGSIGKYNTYVPKGFNGYVVQDSLKDVLPCLYEVVKCPAQGCPNNRVMSEQIIHLNDEHEWTREAIADWAESLDIDISVKEREE